MALTQEQKDNILLISRQAQAFKQSELFSEIKKWVATEREIIMNQIATNTRAKEEENMTRSEFIERRSSYYLSLLTLLTIFDGYANQETELQKLEAHEQSKQSGNKGSDKK